MSKIFLYGLVKNDPEFKISKTGTPWVKFTLQTGERYHSKQTDEKKIKDLAYIHCTAFHTTAEDIAENLKPGDFIAVYGAMQTTSKDTNKDSTAGREYFTSFIIERAYKKLGFNNAFTGEHKNKSDDDRAAHIRHNSKKLFQPAETETPSDEAPF